MVAPKPEIIINNLIEDIDSNEISQDGEDIVYVLLLPTNSYLTIDKKTGNINTEILNIPKQFRHIVQFDTKSFFSHRKIFRLYEINYWTVFDFKTVYISKGEFCPLVK